MSMRRYDERKIGEKIGAAKQLERDLMLQLAIAGHEEVAKRIEASSSFDMRVLTGNYNLFADLLKKLSLKEYIKELLRIQERVREMDLYILNAEETMIRGGMSPDEIRDTIGYIKSRFGFIKSLFIARTRSTRTLASADTEIPKIVPEKQRREIEKLREEAEARGITLSKIVYVKEGEVVEEVVGGEKEIAEEAVDAED